MNDVIVPLIVRDLGLQQDYGQTLNAMQTFTAERTASTADEIWLLEHPPVFTQGLNGKAEHILNAHNIPIVQVDRGGQVTYHGPGQQVLYILLDLRRRRLHLRQIITALEQSMVDVLADYGIEAHTRCDAPGAYVGEEKIGSIGLRIRRGCCYHGLAFNRHMDLQAFDYINPCGYQGLRMTQLHNYTHHYTPQAVQQGLIKHVLKHLHINDLDWR